ncbi:hypothetical protein HZB60_00235 [candidate division KSB1 bacterium]|nr:hypothetical protein [candidate division KSB1 bacterium]
MTNSSDSRLDEDLRDLTELRAGSQGAANRLINRYQKPLTGFVLGHCTCARDQAADLVQEIWIRTLPELTKPADAGGYDPAKGSFYTFLINRHARYLVLQFIDRTRRRPESVVASADDGAVESRSALTDEQDNAESLLIKREELRRRHDLLTECFRLTFLHGGYPHQVLAFGFSKLILGQSTRRDSVNSAAGAKRRREIEGDPQRLDTERGGEDLKQLADAFWECFQRGSGLDQPALDRLAQAMQPTRNSLPLTVEQMAVGNRLFLDHHAAIAGRIVGQTALRDYYGARGLNAIADWCDKVQNRVRDRLGVGRHK